MTNLDTVVAAADVPSGRASDPPRFYYGWACVAAAAVAMVATLPGRTVGLGLAAEPLARDLGMDRAGFAAVNTWATLLGAGFAVAAGRLTDRVGGRAVLAAAALLLGLAVLGLSRAAGYGGLLAAVTLTRGFGQSALSAASIAVVGKWFDRRAGHAMAVYAVVGTVGFMAAIPALEAATRAFGWRAAWAGMGLLLAAGVAPLLWLVARDTPEAVGLTVDGGPADPRPNDRAAGAGGADPLPAPATDAAPADAPPDLTLGQALATPAFWALAAGSVVYAGAVAGITLFNESILAERGVGGSVVGPLVAMAFAGLAGNFLAGWLLAGRVAVARLMAAALLLFAGSLLALPFVRAPSHAVAYGAAVGLSGGIVTVVFFAGWGRLYGRRHLGRIQGAAQAATVVASAAGPAALAAAHAADGSYVPAFHGMAAAALAAGVACLLVRPRQ